MDHFMPSYSKIHVDLFDTHDVPITTAQQLLSGCYMSFFSPSKATCKRNANIWNNLQKVWDQGFIQDFWLGGGEIYWCINEARKCEGVGGIPPPWAPQKILRIWPP